MCWIFFVSAFVLFCFCFAFCCCFVHFLKSATCSKPVSVDPKRPKNGTSNACNSVRGYRWFILDVESSCKHYFKKVRAAFIYDVSTKMPWVYKLNVYSMVVRPVLEYECQVGHSNLPQSKSLF